MNKIDDIIEELNGFGRYQKLRYILICFSGLLPPIMSYMHSFIAASPKYRYLLFKRVILIIVIVPNSGNFFPVFSRYFNGII